LIHNCISLGKERICVGWKNNEAHRGFIMSSLAVGQPIWQHEKPVGHELKVISSLPKVAGDWLATVLQRLSREKLDLSSPPAQALVLRQAADVRLDLASDDDWETVGAVCGYGAAEFAAAKAALPLSAAAIKHFCRNHRDYDASLAGQFSLSTSAAVPENLVILYGLYHAQTRLDAEAALFLAQTSGSTRVAKMMAHLLAIGGFNHAATSLSHNGRVYAIAAAFDTAAVIDAVNQEAQERLAVPPDHPEHLLQALPESIGICAAAIADRARLSPEAFLRKANLLAEARQDVNRFAPTERFAEALYEGDLPISELWVQRLVEAMNAVIPALAGRALAVVKPDIASGFGRQ
jgi:hypothetical protein